MTEEIHPLKNDVAIDITEVSDNEKYMKEETIEEKVKALLAKTQQLQGEEGEIGVRAGLRKYPWAFFWALFMSLGIVACGFDQSLISTFYASPTFQRKYGSPDPSNPGSYYIDASWQSALTQASPIGQIIGPLITPLFAERLGRKKVMFLFTVMLTGFNFIQFFAQNIGTLCAGEYIAGILWGTFVQLSPLYSAEVAPTSMRAVVSSVSNLAFVIGQYVALGVQAGFQNSRQDQWSYRAPFAFQWLWSFLVFAGIWWAPESPWWLVRNGRKNDAAKALRQLGWKIPDEKMDEYLSVMQETCELEKEIESSVSFKECFKKSALLRTEGTVMPYVIQVLVGNWFVSYLTYFFELAGFSTKQAFNLGVGSNSIGFVATLLSWPLMKYFGRRTLYLWGCFLLAFFLLLMGCIDCSPKFDSNESIRYAVASMLIIWQAVYEATIGPVCFVIMGEIPSTQLKSHSIALSIAASSVFGVASAVALPYMFSAGLRGKTGFVFSGLSLISAVWTFYRLPETKGRTFQEIDIMYERGVPLRRFKDYNCYEDVMEESLHSDP